jgi:site-specific DNA-methyltransferase (adenine-specific)
MEYLVKTYTNAGDLILDNAAGSGSTGAAAINLKRRFICIEKDAKNHNIAKERLQL